jgi:hypothetical protein
VLDLIVAVAQPAGLGGMMAVLLIAGVVAVRETRRRATRATGGVAHAESLDGAAANELHRARRYGRPLAIISVTARRREDVARLASELRVSARVNDLVGFVSRSTIVVLLPETAGPEAVGLVRRVADLVDEEAVSRAVVGIASFPQNEVTWIGLRASAQHNVRPLADFRTLRDGVAELGRGLSPSGGADLGPESAFRTSSAAHVADPAA